MTIYDPRCGLLFFRPACIEPRFAYGHDWSAVQAQPQVEVRHRCPRRRCQTNVAVPVEPGFAA
jgi:hypothetical protein